MAASVQLPERLLDRVKIAAADRGLTVQAFITAAVEASLQEPMTAAVVEAKTSGQAPDFAKKPWMKHFGILSDEAEELGRIKAWIEEEFERIEPEDWA